MALHLLALIAVISEPGRWRRALGAVLANHALLTLVGLWPRSCRLGPNWTRLPAAAAATNEIALTIDDGPDPLVTPQVLDMLDRHAAQASFFCVGEKAERYPDLRREIVRRGHAPACGGGCIGRSGAGGVGCMSVIAASRGRGRNQ